MKLRVVSAEYLADTYRGPKYGTVFFGEGAEKDYHGSTFNYFEADAKARIYVKDEFSQPKRLAMTVRHVWRLLPYSVKTRLIKFWRANCIHDVAMGCFYAELANNKLAVGRMMGGTGMTFNDNALALMSDDLMRDVVTHEFGHAWSYTFPDSLFRATDLGDKEWAATEWEADLCAKRWSGSRLKASMERMRKWGHKNDDILSKLTDKKGQWLLPDRSTLGDAINQRLDAIKNRP